MNIDKLKQAEAMFFTKYPKGFADDALIEVGKRHNMDALLRFAQDSFSQGSCGHIEKTAENMIRLVSRSSMVSMFEKPKFRDFVRRLNGVEKEMLVDSMSAFLHGDQATAFESMVQILLTEKLAKWTLISAIPAYYSPTTEVFVKPTTAKGIIALLEVPELVYKPLPTWEFYRRYRDLINTAKTKVDPNLSPSNAAFSGFLMMVMNESDL